MRSDVDAASENRAFLFIAIGLAITLVAGLVLSVVLSTPLVAQISFRPTDLLLGIAAVAPLACFLWWFMRSTSAPIVHFRDSQIDYFGSIGFEFTSSRIAIMALGAGVTEELLFRGVFQTWMMAHAPVAVAIIVPNIVFGLLHARSAAYALIAGIVGTYLGVLFHITGNLIVPIIAHALYDAIALDVTRRAVALRRAKISS